jgi:hypothetical protein
VPPSSLCPRWHSYPTLVLGQSRGHKPGLPRAGKIPCPLLLSHSVSRDTTVTVTRLLWLPKELQEVITGPGMWKGTGVHGRL